MYDVNKGFTVEFYFIHTNKSNFYLEISGSKGLSNNNLQKGGVYFDCDPKQSSRFTQYRGDILESIWMAQTLDK